MIRKAQANGRNKVMSYLQKDSQHIVEERRLQEADIRRIMRVGFDGHVIRDETGGWCWQERARLQCHVPIHLS